MMRPLVLIGAFFLFRALLPRASRRSPTAISPYVNGLDALIPAQQLSSMLDEISPFQPWATRRTNPSADAQIDHLTSNALK
jgi:hypothetical protein